MSVDGADTYQAAKIGVGHSEFEEAVDVGRTTARGAAVDVFRAEP